MPRSLPLMGIWSLRTRSRGIRLSTSHYPSWGFGTIRVGPRLDGGGSSLPLMGIWNYRYRGRACEASPFHYPSWGFGTLTRRSRRTAAITTHYPSWGFGTSRIAARTASLCVLITPHGDLEPDPLAVFEAALGLITPHGDLERQRPSAAAGSLLRAHYPSWGFGTGHEKSGQPRALGAHYPSWGFGTRASPARTWGLIRSLPLMGIWNRKRRVELLDRGLRSLPLMGIWNLRPAGRSACGCSAHYPSWGFGTRY